MSRLGLAKGSAPVPQYRGSVERLASARWGGAPASSRPPQVGLVDRAQLAHIRVVPGTVDLVGPLAIRIVTLVGPRLL